MTWRPEDIDPDTPYLVEWPGEGRRGLLLWGYRIHAMPPSNVVTITRLKREDA